VKRADLHLMVVRANRCFIAASIVLAAWGSAAVAIWYGDATLWLRMSASLAMVLAGVVWGTLIIRSGWDRPSRQITFSFREDPDAQETRG